MGYRYQNKLDDEREREFWGRVPWWRKLLYRLLGALLVLLALYGSFGWVIVKLFLW